ncbi:YDG/SRA domain-containing protein [Amycolatopsis panacis]|uniref:YDG domain-containing protein n=1 Tax=Amycolatopsis panacis TaxID=2340917 RepID=A0A419I348_9PSEU|nr:YDG/SRA domain-containing protein [Amycolatopsis panacis]RJQ84462.1 hypothetical protein D5S19_16875 [Amycolatopsis panacis]
MALADIDRQHVQAAVDESERSKKSDFLAKHGLPKDERYQVLVGHYAYPARAIVCRAYQLATGSALAGSQATGAARPLVDRLADLGYEVLDRATAPKFGEIPKVPEGTMFINRRAATARGTHRARQGGIVGTGKTGAESIVVSGGYADQDFGSVILYTGHGGRNGDTGEQTEDQTFADSGNAALVTSRVSGALVRVIRGAHKGSQYGPQSGYRYDGLYRVEDAAYVRKDGLRLCQFRMVKPQLELDVFATLPTRAEIVDELAHDASPAGNPNPKQTTTMAKRTARIAEIIQRIKRIHQDTCQMCGLQLVAGDRTYSQGAHIKALGGPHYGPDTPGNVLCLCPNCHALFDLGAILIQDDCTLLRNGAPAGQLRIQAGHVIDMTCVAHHRDAHTKS